MKNNKYAKIIIDQESKKSLEYAPTSFVIEGKGVIGNPTKSDYLSAGWKEVTGIRPPERPKYHIIVVDYVEHEQTIETLYNYEADPVIPRHWTPLSVKRTIDKHVINYNDTTVTMWTLLRNMLVEMNYLEDFWGSQYIAEDDDAYLMAYSKACERFGQDFIDKIIDEIPTENT